MLYPNETIHSVDEIEKYLHALGSRSILLGPQGAQESLLCAGLVYRPGQLRILLLKLHATSPNLHRGLRWTCLSEGALLVVELVMSSQFPGSNFVPA